jgi:hypothetical protein
MRVGTISRPLALGLGLVAALAEAGEQDVRQPGELVTWELCQLSAR